MTLDPAAIVFSAIACVAVLVVVYRLWTGKSYMSTPPTAVTRKEDPFSFWISLFWPLLIIGAVIVAAILKLAGL
jgi:hypothetical protein